jgi:hypothetical protein
VEQIATAGTEFARALTEKDFDRIRDLLDPEIDFAGLTPRRHWQAGSPDEVITTILRQWFEDSDEIEALEKLETDAVGDRERVGYRFAVTNPNGRFVVEQQAYIEARDGRITWMRVVCSGFRPISRSD